MQLFIQPIIHFSHACSIQEDNRVIITGGHSTKTVSVYDEYGWREDLPSLNEGRMGHACTSFVSGGKKVCLLYLMFLYLTQFHCQAHDGEWGLYGVRIH